MAARWWTRVQPTLLNSDAGTSLASHRVVWAAEQARHEGSIITLPI
jgi:hypothetical protein